MKFYSDSVKIKLDEPTENKLRQTIKATNAAYPRMMKKLCTRFQFYRKYEGLPVGFRRDLRSIAEVAILEAMTKDHTIDHPWKKAARRHLYLQAIYLTDLFRKGKKEKDIRDVVIPKHLTYSVDIKPSELIVHDDLITAEIPMVGKLWFKYPILIPANNLIVSMRIGMKFNEKTYQSHWYLYYEQVAEAEKHDNETDEEEYDNGTA